MISNIGPWPVRYKFNKTGLMENVWVSPGDLAYGYKVLGHCIPGCQNYGFDDDFWKATMISKFGLVCEGAWMKTFAKMLLFSGFALGSFCSGLVSDRFGRKTAIWITSVVMCIFGVITSLVPWLSHVIQLHLCGQWKSVLGNGRFTSV